MEEEDMEQLASSAPESSNPQSRACDQTKEVNTEQLASAAPKSSADAEIEGVNMEHLTCVVLEPSISTPPESSACGETEGMNTEELIFDAPESSLSAPFESSACGEVGGNDMEQQASVAPESSADSEMEGVNIEQLSCVVVKSSISSPPKFFACGEMKGVNTEELAVTASDSSISAPLESYACSEMGGSNMEQLALAAPESTIAPAAPESTAPGSSVCGEMKGMNVEQLASTVLESSISAAHESSACDEMEGVNVEQVPPIAPESPACSGMEEVNTKQLISTAPKSSACDDGMVGVNVKQLEYVAPESSACVEIGEVDIEQLASTAPDSVDVTTSLTGSKTSSFRFSKSTSDVHTRHFSEDLSSLTINDLRVNNGNQCCHDQNERKGTNQHDHTRYFSEDLSSLTLNDLHANKGEENYHSLQEREQISRHNSVERDIYKAAEIAERFIQSIDNRVFIDSGSPIESVKEAVSKFGGILDWKKRREHVQSELEKALKDAPEYQRRAEVAQVEKSKVLTELLNTRQIIEGLKLNLEKAHIEAVHAQQDSELANIRFKEIQQGIASKESAAIQAEIKLAKYRHESALSELQSVKDELEQLQKEYHALNNKKESAKAKACESNTTSQKIEKTVDDLTLELITLKELLTSLQATYILAQEKKVNVALTYQQEKANFQNELKQADEEVQKLSDAISLNKDLESRLKVASATLVDMRDIFSSYLEEKPPLVMNLAEGAQQPKLGTRLKLARIKKELEDMRTNIEKAKDEVKGFWNAAATLRADIEKENTDIATLRRKEHIANITITSLQEEIHTIICEVDTVRERTKAAQMPVEVQKATEELEHAKSKARLACREVAKAREEADQVKSEVNVIKLKLEAVSREILAMNASKEIATASANALSGYKAGAENEPQADRRMAISLEEYDMLKKKTQEAEDLAKKQVIRAVEKIKEAKRAEVRILDQLQQVTKQIDAKRLELKAAQDKSNSAQYGKLTMENELRKRRAVHERELEEGDTISEIPSLKNASQSFDARSSSSKPRVVGALFRADTIAATTIKEPKSRSFFPRSVVTMFMSRKKTHLK